MTKSTSFYHGLKNCELMILLLPYEIVSSINDKDISFMTFFFHIGLKVILYD
jgi:hypothetical protein